MDTTTSCFQHDFFFFFSDCASTIPSIPSPHSPTSSIPLSSPFIRIIDPTNSKKSLTIHSYLSSYVPILFWTRRPFFRGHLGLTKLPHLFFLFGLITSSSSSSPHLILPISSPYIISTTNMLFITPSLMHLYRIIHSRLKFHIIIIHHRRTPLFPFTTSPMTSPTHLFCFPSAIYCFISSFNLQVYEIVESILVKFLSKLHLLFWFCRALFLVY